MNVISIEEFLERVNDEINDDVIILNRDKILTNIIDVFKDVKLNNYNIHVKKLIKFCDRRYKLPINAISLEYVEVNGIRILKNESNIISDKDVVYSIKGNYIYLNTDIYTEAIIVYSVYPTDLNTFLIVPDKTDFLNLVISYIIFAIKRKAYIKGSISINELNAVEQKYYILRSDFENNFNSLTPEDAMYLANLFNTHSAFLDISNKIIT